MVATEVLPLFHVPPVTVLLRLVVKPWHTTGTPSIADGAGFTVTTVDMAQLPGIVYIIVAVPPAPTPVTIPVDAIVATPVLELLHVPPAIASVSDVVNPEHTFAFPRIAVGIV